MQLKHFGLAALAISIGSSSACSTATTISDVWRDPNYSAAPMRKMFVFGGLKSETNRRSLEDGFAASLARHGVQATPSYSVFPTLQVDREAVRQYLKSQNYDGALVVKFEGLQTQTRVEPGAGFGYYYGGLWGPDYYVETDQYVKVETSLWDARTDKLIWSAVSQTENPSSSSDAISSVVTKITSSLTEAGFIPQTPAVAYLTQQRAY
jgi:hypothetical protein